MSYLRDDVEQIGKHVHVLGDDRDDLYDLAVAEAGVSGRLNIGLVDTPTLARP